MRLLLVTQVVDQHDPILGFFHAWVIEFAKQVEQIEIICLREGTHSLPENVRVHTLGKKEKGRGVFVRVAYIIRFFSVLWKLRNSYDAVFVHMNPEYVVLAGWWWHLTGKRIGLWYTHKHVGIWLRVAEWFSHYVFTASKESFRLASKKVQVMGHGIDVDAIPERTTSEEGTTRFITIGRIAPVKNLLLQIEALALLPSTFRWSYVCVGGPATIEDKEYAELVRARAQELSLGARVMFTGPLPHTEALQALSNADVFIHTSDTGSLDKVLLEALAAGLRIVTTSDLLPEAPNILRAETSPVSIGEMVMKSEENTEDSRTYVALNHGLKNLIVRVIATLSI